MHYDYLVEFATVARERSISKAAVALSLSQSVLSRHVAALEHDLGVRLIERGPRGIALTKDGEYVLSKALDVTEIGDALHVRFSTKSSTERRLVVGGLIWDMDLVDRLSRHLGSLSSAGETYRLQFVASDFPSFAAQAQAQLDACDIWLFCVDDDRTGSIPPEYDAYTVASDALQAVVTPSHPFARCSSIEIEHLRSQTIAHGEGDLFGAKTGWLLVKHLCTRAGFNPLSRTVPFNTLADLYSLDLKDSVLVVGRNSELYRNLISRGNVGVPIEGQSFVIVGACRRDNFPARKLLAGLVEDAAAPV